MDLFLRIEVHIFALAILLLLIRNTRHDAIMLPDEKLFQLLLCSSFVCVALDAITWCINGVYFVGGQEIAIIGNVFYFFSCVFVPYVWTLYVDFRIREDVDELRRRAVWYGIPLYIFFVLIIATPYTHWVFSVDEQNVYQRGPLYMVQIAISFAYMLYPTLLAIRKARKAQIEQEQREWNHIAGFIIATLVGATLQVILPKVPLVSVCIVFAELIIFINVQNKQISLDALTKINNRGQLNHYLNIKTNAYRKDDSLYMLLIDIDKFKKINDTYGHEVGDRAILDTTSVLKKVCDKYHAFLARYGGDEFAIVVEGKKEEDVKRLVKDIELQTIQLNALSKEPYTIHVSVGYAEYGKNKVDTVERLIEAADNQMYIKKHNKKKQKQEIEIRDKNKK